MRCCDEKHEELHNLTRETTLLYIVNLMEYTVAEGMWLILSVYGDLSTSKMQIKKIKMTKYVGTTHFISDNLAMEVT